VCLQNCCKLRFLTAVEITIITQCSETRLILMLNNSIRSYYIEKFVVIMYDMFSGTDNIDEARLAMFIRKQVI
jgi:hypothetical protein